MASSPIGVSRVGPACLSIARRTLPLTLPCYDAQVRCLNEATEGSGRGVFRRWEDRLNVSGPPLARQPPHL